MPRFVVIEHDHPRGRHWDLMLEIGSVLATWALDRPPDAAGPIPATSLPDHRTSYLDYEGPISGGRGSVSRWDAGEYQLHSRSETELTATLAGEKLTGRIFLTHRGDDPARWQFCFEPS
jgi:hypothetical protein